MRNGRSVVVVDDNTDCLSRALEALAKAGYDVAGAASFQEARQLLSLGWPDLLIADVRLGSHNGLHLVVLGHAAKSDMAAIVTTAYEDRVLEQEAGRNGAQWVVKPYDTESLLQLVSKLLAGVAGQGASATRT